MDAPQALSRPELLARLAALADALRLDHPTRVAFDGPDTAGKTTLGDELVPERRYRIRYIPGQRLYVADARPDATADVVVRNDDPAAPVPERVGGRALSPGTGRPAR